MNQNLYFLPQIIVRSPLNPTNDFNENILFIEALYISSPDLYHEIIKKENKAEKNNPSLQKRNISLHKFSNRASNRCTPFGLFAGINLATWGNENEILLDSTVKNSLYRKTCLNMPVLCNLVKEIETKDFIKPYLKYYSNTSIYLIGDNYRYVEHYDINNKRTHQINSVDQSPYLELILHESAKGLTELQLVQLLINDDINSDEATGFINELISSQILVNQFEPTLTGLEFFDTIINNLTDILQQNKSENLQDLLNRLNRIKTCLHNIDTSIVNSIDSYKMIFDDLKFIIPGIQETKLFHTDLFKNTLKNTLDNGIKTQLINAIDFLNKITPNNTNHSLEEFKKKFQKKYEDDEISLLLALDEETGIGYPIKKNGGVNHLIEDIQFPVSNNEPQLKWTLYEQCLLKLINDSQKSNSRIIEIGENDFETIDYSNANLPSSFAVMFNLLNANTNKIKLINSSGSSAANLLGRFANSDKKINDIIKKIVDFEQTQIQDKILAEIIHLPEYRVGSILSRSAIRKYEIPYLTKSSVPNEYQIKVQDLTLKIRNNKLILFDKRLQKEIVPRLSNAHNYKKSDLPVYYFLCDIQTQYFTKPNLGFNWGALSSQFNFLPRIEYQNTVLSAAKWQLKKQNLEPFKNKKLTESEKHMTFFELKKQLNLDDKFLLMDEDSEFLIDSNNKISIDSFIDIIKNKNEITLEEYLFDNNNALIKDTTDNKFSNECIAILLNEHIIQENENFSINKLTSSKPVFSIGSEWLYYKIYCGPKTGDTLLTSKIKQLTSLLIEKEIIDKWFFIRYNDPDTHLRFRLHITNPEKLNEAIQLVSSSFEKLIEEHIISDIQIHTYKRETERYGDNSIELAEQLFYNDSVFVTNVLSLIDSNYKDEIRWQIAIKSVDDLLNGFALNLEQKHQLIDQLSNSFFKEHGGHKELKITLDNKYRKLKSEIEGIFDWGNNSDYFPVIELLKQRQEINKPIVNKILLMQSHEQLQVSLNKLIASFLHMNLNRLFMGRNRTNEFVIYDLLCRYYKSSLIRLKN
jgi:thiopeptide-type bacteriocin biosynthesis protein